MNEEQLLKRKIIDTANQAFNHNIYTYTNFLSINELSSVNKMSNELSFIPYDEWGGNPVCERKIIRFGSEELYGYELSDKLAVGEVTNMYDIAEKMAGASLIVSP